MKSPQLFTLCGYRIVNLKIKIRRCSLEGEKIQRRFMEKIIFLLFWKCIPGMEEDTTLAFWMYPWIRG